MQKLRLSVRPIWALGKGHPAKISGAGAHSDRRTRRLRTRGDQRRRSVEDGQ